MEQTPAEIVNEIIMSRDPHAWLAVEGYSDEKLLRERNFPSLLKIVVGFGWEGVRDILIEYSKVKSNIKLIGLMDRDYREHLNCQVVHDCLVFTDYRDIENMLFNSSALKRVISEYASKDKIPKTQLNEPSIEEIKNAIYKISVKLGKFRIYCESKNKNISFSGIEYKKFVCDRTLSFNTTKFLSHLQGKNTGNKVSITQEDWNNAQALSWSKTELNLSPFIANGHDVMAIFSMTLWRMWGNRKQNEVSAEFIEGIFRVGYSDDDLKKTNMWRNLEEKLTSDVTQSLG